MPAPFSIGIYSQNGRTSKDMMTKIHTFLCQASLLFCLGKTKVS